MGIEFSILDFIQTHLRSGAGDTTMVFITTLGNAGAVWLLLGGALLAVPKTRRIGAAVLLAVGLEVLLCSGVLKPFVARLRPCDVNPTVQLLISRPADYSFPSGHTGASFAAASALWFSRCRGRTAAVLLACAIAFSRLYLYVHYPSDVLAGALLGILCGRAAVAAVHRVQRIVR